MSERVHDLHVVDVVTETADAVSFVLAVPAAVADRFEYASGQFLTVRVPSASTGSVARCYSLSSSPLHDEQLVVTVKRIPGGYASNWLCDNVAPGSTLTVLEPAGTFVLGSSDRDVLLCAAGSGITPVVSLAKTLLAVGTGRVVLLYANENRESIIFAGLLAELEQRFAGRLVVEHWLVNERGLPTPEPLSAVVAGYDFDDVYLCGPAGFMDTVRAALSSCASEPLRIRQEEYRSLSANPFAPKPAANSGAADRNSNREGPVVEVEIGGVHHRFEWQQDRTLLDVLLDNGIDAPYVCRESVCGTCVCSVRKGRTRMLMNDSLPDEDVDMGLTLACQTLPESDEVYIAFDQ